MSDKDNELEGLVSDIDDIDEDVIDDPTNNIEYKEPPGETIAGGELDDGTGGDVVPVPTYTPADDEPKADDAPPSDDETPGSDEVKAHKKQTAEEKENFYRKRYNTFHDRLKKASPEVAAEANRIHQEIKSDSRPAPQIPDTDPNSDEFKTIADMTPGELRALMKDENQKMFDKHKNLASEFREVSNEKSVVWQEINSLAKDLDLTGDEIDTIVNEVNASHGFTPDSLNIRGESSRWASIVGDKAMNLHLMKEAGHKPKVTKRDNTGVIQPAKAPPPAKKKLTTQAAHLQKLRDLQPKSALTLLDRHKK